MKLFSLTPLGFPPLWEANCHAVSTLNQLHVMRNWGLFPAASGEANGGFKTTATWVRLEVDHPAPSSCQMSAAPADMLVQYRDRPWDRTSHLSCFWIPDSESVWDKNCLLVKTAKFGGSLLCSDRWLTQWPWIFKLWDCLSFHILKWGKITELSF